MNEESASLVFIIFVSALMGGALALLIQTLRFKYKYHKIEELIKDGWRCVWLKRLCTSGLYLTSPDVKFTGNVINSYKRLLFTRKLSDFAVELPVKKEAETLKPGSWKEEL